MKIPALILAAASAAAAQPAWTGLAVTGSQTSFALRASPAGHSQWVQIGDAIGGWRVVAFQAAEGILRLEDPRGGVAVVRLCAGGVEALPPADAQATAIALLAVAARDGWQTGAEALPPQRRDHVCRVLVRRGSEARMVVIGEDGAVLDEWKV